MKKLGFTRYGETIWSGIALALVLINIICIILSFVNVSKDVNTFCAILLIMEVMLMLFIIRKDKHNIAIKSYIISYFAFGMIVLVQLFVCYKYEALMNWKLLGFVTVIYLIAYGFLLKDKINYKAIITMCLLAGAVFTTIGFDILNVECDDNSKKNHSITVIDKAYFGRHYFVSEFEFFVKGEIDKDEYWVSVPLDIYKTIECGETIDVTVGSGFLDRKYYYYSDCKYRQKTYDFSIIVPENSFYRYLENQKKM